jgi:hypothetical protein
VASDTSINIFGLLREGREGVQFEHIFRMLSFVVHQWYEYQGVRNKDDTEPSDKLRSIPFDKLVTFVTRLWDKLYAQRDMLKLDSLGSEINLSLDTEGLTFPCPMREMPGKHGPGRAIYDGQQKPEYITSVLYRLQQDDIVHYFTITPPMETIDGIGQRLAEPTHPNTTITPAVQITNKRRFFERFTSREVEIITDLSSGVKKLNPSEIRALGTHHSRETTSQAIRWEFKALNRLGTSKKIGDAIRTSTPFTGSAQQWLEYADEACSKSRENRGVYETAWTTVSVELTDRELKEIFGITQALGSAIWEGQEVQRLWLVASKSRVLARYFLAVSMGLAGSSHRTGDALEQAASACVNLGIPALPNSAGDVFSSDGTLPAGVQRLLTTRLDEMFQEMQSCRRA